MAQIALTGHLTVKKSQTPQLHPSGSKDKKIGNRNLARVQLTRPMPDIAKVEMTRSSRSDGTDL